MTAAWGTTLVRGMIYLGITWLYTPVVRYGLTGIIPTVLASQAVWTVGWQAIQVHCPKSRGFGL